MILVKRKSDGWVQYVGNDGDTVVLTDKYLKFNHTKAHDINATTHEIEVVPDVPAFVESGSSNRVDGVWSVRNLDTAKTALKAQLAALRYEKESAGTTAYSQKIDTSRESQSLIIGIALRAQGAGAKTIKFKTKAGRIINATPPQITGIFNAVHDHVQACRTREADLTEAIDNASTPAELEAINITEGWPE